MKLPPSCSSIRKHSITAAERGSTGSEENEEKFFIDFYILKHFFHKHFNVKRSSDRPKLRSSGCDLELSKKKSNVI